MDPSPLRKLWGRRAEPSAELTSALADLARSVGTRPELAGPGRTLTEVLRAAFLVPPGIGAVAPDVGRALIAWGEGTPAFRAAVPPIAVEGVRERGLGVCGVLSKENATAGPLLAALRGRRADLSALWREGLAGGPDAIDRAVAPLGLDLGLVLAVLRLALLPELARASEVLGPLRPEGLWDRGDCPHCGQWPVLAESRGLEQRRRLRCGWCAADWAGDRLRCPFCATADHQALHYRFIEGEGDRRRLALCDRCGGRLKVVSTLAPLSAPGLLVSELLTVHLDLIDGRNEG
jgi:FdhE protein